MRHTHKWTLYQDWSQGPVPVIVREFWRCVICKTETIKNPWATEGIN